MNDIVDTISWDKIVKDGLGWLYGLVSFALPWLPKVVDQLGKAILLVEIGGTTDPSQKDQKLEVVINNFEQYLVQENYIPKTVEEIFDPAIDWALKEVIKQVVKFLNNTFGKDWINIFKTDKLPQEFKKSK